MCAGFSALRAEKPAPQRSARPMLPQAKMWRCDAEQRNCVPPKQIKRKNHAAAGYKALVVANRTYVEDNRKR